MSDITCPLCRTNLKKIKKYKSGDLLYRCSCSTYPQIEGIFYLKKDRLNKQLINNLESGKPYLHFFSFSLISRAIFKLISIKPLAKWLGFNNFIRLLTLLGYNRSYAKYIINRPRMPSFFLSLLFFGLIKNKKSRVVDIGCGVGRMLPYISKMASPEHIVAIDKDFFSLYIARMFFAGKNIKLVCCDIEQGLPLKKNSFDNFFVSDTLHYVKSLDLFLNNLKLALKIPAEGAVIHTLNRNERGLPNSLRRSPSEIGSLLKKNGFNDYFFISNKKIWSGLSKNNIIPFDRDRNVKNEPVFNIVFSRKKFLDFGKRNRLVLKNTEVNYYQDRYIIET